MIIQKNSYSMHLASLTTISVLIVSFHTAVVAAQGVTAGFTQPDGAEVQQTDDSDAESAITRSSFQLSLAGANLGLVIDPLTGEKKLDIKGVIHACYCAQPYPDSAFKSQWKMLDLTDELFAKITKMYQLDGEITCRIRDSLHKQIVELTREGRPRDDPKIVELLEAKRLAAHELYVLKQAHNEDLSKMLTPEQIDRLKEQAMATAIVEFGGPFAFFKTAFEQRGLRNDDLTPQQRKKVDEALKKYVETVQKAKAELVEGVMGALPKEHRNAIIDAAGIRGLESGQVNK